MSSDRSSSDTLAAHLIMLRGNAMRVPAHGWLFQGLLLVTCLMMVTGCGDAGPERVTTFPVQGAITFQGRPIPGAFVAFHPQTPRANVPAPRANVAADGSLKVTTFQAGDGAPEGQYVLTVEWYKPIKQGGDVMPGPNVIPKKYASPQTSNLKVTIAAQENQLSTIRL
jgi:hypothetical protein